MNDFDFLYQKLIKRLEEVQKFINSIELQKRLVSDQELCEIENSILKQFLTCSEKLINSMVHYNAVIISLYACFENYVDELSKNFFSRYYNVVKEYSKLPQQILDNYYKQVGDFLTNPHRYADIDETPESIIETLYANINNDNDRSFQLELLANHSANLKMDKVIDLLNKIGIPGARTKIISNYLLQSYFINEKLVPRADINNFLSNGKTNVFSELDMLVDARNRVAHGWDDDERISFSVIKESIIPFIKLISKVILEVSIAELFNLMTSEHKIIKLGKAIEVYNKKILCINNKSAKLKIGNYIFFKTPKNTYDVARIQSLQIDCEDKEYINEENIDVGIGLDRPVKGNYIFYYAEH